jgi:aryl-alcohol dehydrogenase-like predicted oxidoreductase
MTREITTKVFGRTNQRVTVVGLGGEGILRTVGYEHEAQAVIGEALAQGITYFDCAQAYAGSEGYYGLVWSKNPDSRNGVFQASKSASRDKAGARADLEQTLATMKIPYLDLWQIHDVRTHFELDAIEAPGGALEAFLEAKDQEKTRFIGVTAHHDPAILATAISKWPIDAVMMPVNPVEGVLSGFLDLIPLARERGLAIIGMKVLGAGHYIVPELKTSPDLLVRYALSQGVTVAIVGCSSPEEVRALADAGRDFNPFSIEEMREIEARFHPYAKSLGFYRGVT